MLGVVRLDRGAITALVIGAISPRYASGGVCVCVCVCVCVRSIVFSFFNIISQKLYFNSLACD